MTRDQFRESVFVRDGQKCIICKAPAVDAHHIIDRSLFEDGGYFLDNGVSLCAEHHLKAEQTLISCDELRTKAGILKIVLPEHLENDDVYDHWGNILLPTGMRIKGELFHQDNVQRVLNQAGVLSFFLSYVKYPRTYHAPWSPNVSNDDKIHKDMTQFLNKDIVVTIKMDGENSSIYPDYYHARSASYSPHESRTWMKALQARIGYDIPKSYRICGENLYAQHSIRYEHLKDFFYVFSIWDDFRALSWKETEEYSKILGLETVPVLFTGRYSSLDSMKDGLEDVFREYSKQSLDPVEGYVIRVAEGLTYSNFRKLVAKVVRKDHVKTESHWMASKVIPNRIENNEKLS